ncbi:glycosyl transferase [Bacteroidia bacterium]|nr:glycosyl transferase [Bacteroidia bacterium]
MKILLIHNNYGVYSGEERVVDQQIRLFHEMGHEVAVFRKTSEGLRDTLWGNLSGLLQGFYSPSSVREIKKIMQKNRPDVAIVHNLYPYISPAVLKPVKQANVPIIMTVHNFRLICPLGLFMRRAEPKPCETCLQKGNEWPCIRYNCELNWVKSIGYAGRNWYARKTKAYIKNVDFYACITQFQIEKLVEAGFDVQKMVHISNFLDKIERYEPQLGDYVAVSGRLSKEKGVDLILQAAAQTPEIQYVFAGSPRAEEPVTEPVPSNCRFLGHISKTELSDFYQKARFLVIASRCYEGFPLTILEIAEHAKPAICPTHAGFLEIIDHEQTGLLFQPNNPDDLTEKIRTLWNDPERCMAMGQNALRKLDTHYTAEVVRRKWGRLFILIPTLNRNIRHINLTKRMNKRRRQS